MKTSNLLLQLFLALSLLAVIDAKLSRSALRGASLEFDGEDINHRHLTSKSKGKGGSMKSSKSKGKGGSMSGSMKSSKSKGKGGSMSGSMKSSKSKGKGGSMKSGSMKSAKDKRAADIAFLLGAVEEAAAEKTTAEASSTGAVTDAGARLALLNASF